MVTTIILNSIMKIKIHLFENANKMSWLKEIRLCRNILLCNKLLLSHIISIFMICTKTFHSRICNQYFSIPWYIISYDIYKLLPAGNISACGVTYFFQLFLINPLGGYIVHSSLIHWYLSKMATILHTTFSNVQFSTKHIAILTKYSLISFPKCLIDQ